MTKRNVIIASFVAVAIAVVAIANMGIANLENGQGMNMNGGIQT